MSLDAALAELRGIVGAACPGAPLQDDLAVPAGPAVAVLPLSAAVAGRTRGADDALELLLRTLVVPLGPSALQLLEQCVLALDAAPGHDLEPDLLPAELWRGLGAAPRPALVVRRRVPLPVPRPRAPVVTERVSVLAGTGRLLQGVVLGPRDLPLPLATVAVDGGAPTRCGADGTFRVLAVDGAATHRLTVSLKGRVLQADVAADDAGPLIVRCESLES